MPDDSDRLFELARSAYGHLADQLPANRGHCREAMVIASAIATALGLPHETCSGFRQMPGNVKDVHHWLLVGGRVLHSPARGSLQWDDPAGFEAVAIAPHRGGGSDLCKAPAADRAASLSFATEVSEER